MAAPHSNTAGPNTAGSDTAGLIEAKRAARAAARARRAAHLPDPASAEALAVHVLSACPPAPGAIVSGFWPVKDEIDVRPLLLALHARGHDIVLPVTGPRGT